ncbi:11545_t:CDS:2 [Acaulospora morrowiae]|uniref:11545_t:CDS:1 n=1 Tax=Acaulospora morrowiae TaxID=94023 RepID=A0A9N8V691_9GLOM|nr:11545_t:CDS:2 [Acaulospora morrowiae]
MTSLKGLYFKGFTKTLLLKMLISFFFRGAFAQESTILMSEITELNCPKPMIWYTDSNITTDMYCINRCCLPCPYLDNFYPDGELDRTYKTFAVFGIVSFSIMLILAALFLVLPSQRNNQTTKQILLPLVLSVCCFEFAEFFTLQQQKSQCTNPVLRANISDNHYCATQAFFTLGGAYAVASWAALLMLHLHLISVWRSEFITRNIFYFNVYIWGTSFLAAVIPMSIGKVEANNICFIQYDYASIYYYFLSFIYVAFLAHLITFSHMAKVTIKANWRLSNGSTTNKRVSIVEAQRTFNHVKTIFALQWRALFGAILMLAVYVVNWSYFDVFSSSTIDSTLFSQWFQCLLNGGSQTSCVPQTIPSINWTIVLLFANRALGILIFLILAAKKIILVEVWNLLNGRIDLRSSSSSFLPRNHGNISMSSIERGERLGRANEADIRVSGITSGLGSMSSDIEDTKSSRTSYSSMTSSDVSPSTIMSLPGRTLHPPSLGLVPIPVSGRESTTTSHPSPSIPARASLGLVPIPVSGRESTTTSHLSPSIPARASLGLVPIPVSGRESTTSHLSPSTPARASLGLVPIPVSGRGSKTTSHLSLQAPARTSLVSGRGLTTSLMSSSTPARTSLVLGRKSSTSHLSSSTPSRASLGVLPRSSLNIRLPLRHSTNRISFSGEISESSKRTSSNSSSNSGSAAKGKVNVAVPNGGFVVKANRTYERNKRRSRELAKKIARNSISEISEDEEEASEDDKGNIQERGSKDGNDDKMSEKRTTFGEGMVSVFVLSKNSQSDGGDGNGKVETVIGCIRGNDHADLNHLILKLRELLMYLPDGVGYQ